MSLMQLQSLSGLKDDAYYSRSFVQIRDRLSSWCIALGKNISGDVYSLTTDVWSLFPCTLAELDSSIYATLYKTNVAFRVCTIQSYIARFLVDTIWVDKASPEMIRDFLQRLERIMLHQMDFSTLISQILEPSMSLAREIDSERRIFSTFYIGAGTVYSPTLHERPRQDSHHSVAQVLFCHFPLLATKESETNILVKAQVSLLSEWTESSILQSLRITSSPVACLEFRQPQPERQSTKEFFKDNSTFISSNQVQTSPISTAYSDRQNTHTPNVSWKQRTLMLAVFSALLVVALVVGVSVESVRKNSESTKFLYLKSENGTVNVKLESLYLAYSPEISDSFAPSNVTSWYLGANGIAYRNVSMTCAQASTSSNASKAKAR